ncbi:S-adenosyl-L-methionine-dependent methyltransferase [Suhomyces tanzawaensis NRRL Y-17324]|uniref:rRNA adenine N(6)-methyltransferase n=1 Tax=Suhomyces tanzawaensis NRRL Y-17324 TaxID=984487 RepID=A0A1E4SF47_9ASCO|nr:S-adenosyl-L-methionine-dependent methyltransferase [Suhomyces tanzawaensis NRRL Y-17324]ODV78095.1 S-adenosyl-L-methionine-dependent methyltransferase [Suhomyces tanzawaensis NRRL Y-17324]
MSSFRSFNPALSKIFLGPLPKFQYNFKHLAKPQQCQEIIDKLDLKSKYPNSANLDIIDIFSGFGLFSTMVNYELKPRNHVIIENTKVNVGHWKERISHLQETTNNKENFHLYAKDGYKWETFDDLIQKDKIVQPSYVPRDKVHDELLIIGNVTPSKFGESLLAQWIMCCIYKNWLQKYGRVRMLCFTPDVTAMKFMSGSSFHKRNKSAIKRELYTESKLVAISEPEDFTEADGSGYDPRLIMKDQPIPLTSRSILPSNGQLALLEIVPKDISAEKYDMYEYVIRSIYFNASQKIKDSLSNIGPGAMEDLSVKLSSSILEKSARELSIDDWSEIFNVYEAWPFKPSLVDTMDIVQDDVRGF